MTRSKKQKRKHQRRQRPAPPRLSDYYVVVGTIRLVNNGGTSAQERKL
jgi:hypothetical protein